MYVFLNVLWSHFWMCSLAMAVLGLTQVMVLASRDLYPAGLISYAYRKGVSMTVVGKVRMTGSGKTRVSHRPWKPGSIEPDVHQPDVKDYRMRMANGPGVA